MLAAAAFLVAAPLAAQQGAQNPHGPLRESCTDCHDAEGWAPARFSGAFDHKNTGFPLAGAHTQTACRACHATLDFKRTPQDCASCHRDVHRGELGTDCARCHTPRNFLDRSGLARAHQQTRFPLTGSHVGLDCERCHTPAPQGRLTFVNRASGCVDCHHPDYQAARSPDHQAVGMPTNCTECHSTLSWAGGRMNHAATRFPLTGAHRAVSCAQCHGDNLYSPTSMECVSCHQQAYDATTQPGHLAAGFPTACKMCHTTTTWTGATFDHGRSGFPLTGAHVTAGCQQCHGDGVYRGKSTTCVSCHQAAYDAASDPDHRAAQLPTDCASCHTTIAWDGARYTAHDATYFPIYSGAHRGRWSSCQTCHTVATDYGQFTCLSCHGKSGTDSHHSGVSGYRYDSQACYSCHRNGRGDD